MTVEIFGEMPDGTPVSRIKISAGPLSANVITYGAVLQDLRLQGHQPALVLGFDSFAPYLTHSPYFGATAGRCANRIAGGHLTLGGKTYQLDQNDHGGHHLHGGSAGIGRRNWTIDDVQTDRVRLSIRLDDGDMGYPGNMAISASFQVLPAGVLDISYSATTDQTTLCNLAHHSYFNLDGEATILDHVLQVDADTYVPLDDLLIPTGEVKSLTGTPVDFRQPKPIEAAASRGILDCNFCLAETRQPLRAVACLQSPRSGLAMEIRTTEVGLQVYDGAKISVPVAGLDGRHMGARAGIALEPQIWPDASHHPHFPQAVLEPGEVYSQQTQYAFLIAQ